MIKRTIKPLFISIILLVTLFLSLRAVQARRFYAADASNFYDVVRVCRDGMEIGFARHSTTVSVTGAWWHQDSSVQILGEQSLTLDSVPVDIPGTGTVPYSKYFTLPWTENTNLLPGHRIKMALDETSSQDIWATVQDCLVNDGALPVERFVFPDISQDDANGGDLTSGETTFTMTVALTETVGAVNVAMFVQNESVSDSLNLSAWLTSPEGTTVQLINNVSDSGEDFGFRCREQNQNLIGDPLADLVFDDVSQFDFTDSGVFGSFEMLYAINPLEALSTFEGEDFNGVWSLKFQNLTPAVSAYLNCWMLQISDVPAVPLSIVNSVTSASSLPEPGGDFDFEVVVTNDSKVDTVTITDLDDTYLANLQTNGTCTESGSGANTVAPYTLAPAEFLTCTYTVNHSGQPAKFDNTVSVKATDDDGADVGGDSNQETVEITDATAVSLSIVKSVTSASSLPEPGGNFDFQVVITNSSTVDTATVTDLDDTYLTNLQTNGTCTESGSGANTVAPYTLSPAEYLTCNFTVNHSGQPATFDNTVSVKATDDDGADVGGDSNQKTVEITDATAVPLSIVKSVTSASSLPEPGGNFDFQVVITNSSTVDTATVTDLDDTYLTNLQTNGTCTESGSGANTVAPYTLSPAEYLTCTFTVNHSGQPATFNNTVSVTATDDDGANVGGLSNEISVSITDVATVPLTIIKSVTSASSLPEPGGDFDFQVVVANTSDVKAAIVTDLDDTYLANLQTNGTCTESGSGSNTVAPYTLSPAESLTCTYTVNHSGQPATFYNTVNVTATDDDGADVGGVSNEISVSITDVSAVPLSIVKSVTSESSLPEPGGHFDFQVVVTNTSAVDTVTVTDLDDTYLANLQTNGTCTESGSGNNTVAPYILSPAEYLTCTYTVNHSGQPATFDHTVTVTATDDDDAIVGGVSNKISVAITDVAGVPLSIVKSVTSASSLPEPGGNFDFRVVVSNTSTVDTATVTDLDDTYLANLQTNGTCSESGAGNNTVAPYTLSPAESLTCTFTVNHSGEAATFDNTVSVSSTDDDGANVGGDSNSIQVEITVGTESYALFLPMLKK